MVRTGNRVGRGRALGAAAVAGALLVACGGGFDGDPYATVVAAVDATLELPLAVDVHVEIDSDRLVEAMRASGDADAAAGFAMLGGQPIDLRLEITAAEAGLHVAAVVDDVTLGAVHHQDGQPPVVRLADETPRSVPVWSFARGFAPELFTGGWVELTGVPPFAQLDLDAGFAVVRQELAAVPRDEIAAQFRIVHVDDDRDGWRFELTPGPQAIGAPEGARFDVWVDDDRLSRVRMDLGPFAAAEEPTLSLEELREVVVFDAVRSSRRLPPRPVAESQVDVGQLGGS